jgi:hypothetical protein
MKREIVMPWVYDPHSGGVKIPPAVRQRTEKRILAYANQHYAGKFIRLGIRFHGTLCYIDAFVEPPEPTEALLRLRGETREQFLETMRNAPLHLCRLRYFGNEDRWSMAFYTYSHEKYEPCVFDTGKDHGTPEEAFETAAVYLQDR